MKSKYKNILNSANLLFLIYVLFCLNRLFEGVFGYFLNLVILLLVFKSIKEVKLIYNKTIFYIFIYIYVFLMAFGIIYANYYIFILTDISKFSLLFLVFMPQKPTLYFYKSEFPRLAAKWLYFGLPFTIFLLLYFGIQASNPEARDTYLSSEENIFLPGKYILFSVFLVPFIRQLNKFEKIIVIFSNILVLVIGFLTVSRSFILAPIISFLLTIIFLWKFRSKFFILTSLIFIIPILFIFISETKVLNTSFTYFIERLQLEDFSNGRDDEEELYLESITDVQLLFGKGFGGTNNTWIWQNTEHGSSMMHKGYMYLCLKGGVLVVFLYYLLVLSSIYYYIFRNRQFIAWGVVLLLFLILELSTTQWIYTHHIIFLSISLSFYVNRKMLVRTSKIKSNVMSHNYKNKF